MTKKKHKKIEIYCKRCNSKKLVRFRSSKTQIYCSTFCANLDRTKNPLNIKDATLKNLYAQGKTMKQIAHELDVSWKAVQRRLHQLKVNINPRKREPSGKYITKYSEVSRRRTSEHRVVMEKTLGRKLTTKEIVHHIDLDPKNNVEINLMLTTREEHNQIHWQLTQITSKLIKKGIIVFKNGGYEVADKF